MRRWQIIASLSVFYNFFHQYDVDLKGNQIDPDAVWKVIKEDLPPLRLQVANYLTNIDWDSWEKNEVAISETAIHKGLIQTAARMKMLGYDVVEICRITGLSADEVEEL